MGALTADSSWFHVSDGSDVGRIRRAAMRLADDLAFGEYRVGEVGIVATELAANLHRYASDAVVGLSVRRVGDDAGVELLAIDRGPGISDIDAVFADGVSSAGTLGIGLGAVRRLSTCFDVHTEQGRGTIMLAAIWRGSYPCGYEQGALTRPMRGEEVCGDSLGVEVTDELETYVVADGLGHGPLAKFASAEAIGSLAGGPMDGPGSIIQRMHGRLRATRGAAVAVVQYRRRDRILRFAGTGNIATWICSPERRRGLVSSPGIVGHNMRKVQTDQLEIESGSVLVMHSDGLTDKWRLDDQAGLLARSPGVIAGNLMRDAGTRHDDASILVARLA